MVGHGEVMAEDNSSETPDDASVSRRLLTLKEVSDMLRVHPNSIRRWSDTGLLPAAVDGHQRPGSQSLVPEVVVQRRLQLAVDRHQAILTTFALRDLQHRRVSDQV